MAKLPSGRPPLSLSPTHPPSRRHRRTFAALHPRCHTQPSKLIVLPHRSVVTRSVIIIRFKTNSLCRVSFDGSDTALRGLDTCLN